MSSKENTQESRLDRRSLLSALTATAGISLAGCQGNDGGNGGDGGNGQGERVPPLQFEYATGIGDSTLVYETCAPEIKARIEEIMGVPVEIVPKDYTTQFDQAYADKRTANMMMWGDIATPVALYNPLARTEHLAIQYAGQASAANYSHYADCEYSVAVEKASQAANKEELQKHFNDMQRAAAEDEHYCPLFPRGVYSAYRSDQISIDSGEMGLVPSNLDAFLTAEIKEGPLGLTANANTVEQTNHFNIHTPSDLMPLTYLVYSPLVQYSKDIGFKPRAATDWKSNEDSTEWTFNLRDGMTFHNGDPVTPEDVKLTYELIFNNDHVLRRVPKVENPTFEIPDDSTITIKFNSPNPLFLSSVAGLYGIVPKSVWEDALDLDDVTTYKISMNEMIGSGPCKVVNRKQGQILQLEPVEDHWMDFNTPVNFLTFEGSQAAVNALKNGNLTALMDMGQNTADELRKNDNMTVNATATWTSFWLQPMMQFGPTQKKFTAFRKAMNKSLDRQLMAELCYGGDIDPYLECSHYPPETNPWVQKDVVPTVSDSLTPSPEAAKAVLEENGWSWDDDGRLRYPPDADTSPMWPQGAEGPVEMPDKFPCVEEYNWG